MEKIIKIGMAVIAMGLLAKLLFGGSPDKDVDIPALVKAGAVVIDVRTAQEFAGGHIEGAIHIPYDVINRTLDDHNKDQAIIVYCHSGARSATAKKTLEQSGYTNVVNGGSLHRMRKHLESGL